MILENSFVFLAPSVSSSSSETSDSESSSESGEEPVKQQAATKVEVMIKPLSEQEMNQLGAKILKAELMGNEVYNSVYEFVFHFIIRNELCTLRCVTENNQNTFS